MSDNFIPLSVGDGEVIVLIRPEYLADMTLAHRVRSQRPGGSGFVEVAIPLDTDAAVVTAQIMGFREACISNARKTRRWVNNVDK